MTAPAHKLMTALLVKDTCIFISAIIKKNVIEGLSIFFVEKTWCKRICSLGKVPDMDGSTMSPLKILYCYAKGHW